MPSKSGICYNIIRYNGISCDKIDIKQESGITDILELGIPSKELLPIMPESVIIIIRSPSPFKILICKCFSPHFNSLQCAILL